MSKISPDKYLRIGSAFVPIHEAYLETLNNYYLNAAKDMVSLNLIQDTQNDKMLFNYLFDNTDKGWVTVGIKALKKGIKQDLSEQRLPQLLKRMRYINRTH